MFGVTTSDDYRPVAWMGRYPVDVTTMLVGVHVAAAILAAILVAFGAGSILLWLQFDSAAIWSSGQVWRLFTYAFVHAPSGLLWFAIEMYLLFVFGREVERFLSGARFLGQRAYIALYAFFAGHTRSATDDLGTFGNGAQLPVRQRCTLEFLLRLPPFIRVSNCCCGSMAKWVALILAAIYTLQLLAYHAWSDLVVYGRALASHSFSSN